MSDNTHACWHAHVDMRVHIHYLHLHKRVCSQAHMHMHTQLPGLHRLHNYQDPGQDRDAPGPVEPERHPAGGRWDHHVQR